MFLPRVCAVRVSCLAVLCSLVTALGAGAQTAPEARVRVAVVDQTAAAIDGATVTLTGDGVETVVPGSEVGLYTLDGLAGGDYQLTVQFEGFAPVQRRVRLRSGRLTSEKVVLTVSHSEALDVVGLPLVGRTGLNGLTLTGKEIDMLPTNEIEMLYRLLELAGSRGRPGDVAIYVDGFREFRRLPPKAAIEVIQINAEPYSAEFAEPGTRRIEIITKPGADGTFGELKADFNDESLNATDPLAVRKPPRQKKTASGYLSGPIVKQKWGFVAYAGMWDQAENALINANVLNEALDVVPFRDTLAAPFRISNYTFNTGFSPHQRVRFRLEYSLDEVYARNQGLKGGLSLPERAIGVDSDTRAARLNFLYVLGPATVFDVRAQHKIERSRTRAADAGPATIVADGFLSGANQAALDVDERKELLQVDSKFTTQFGKHLFATGVQSALRTLNHFSRADTGGTYTFGSDVVRDALGEPVLDADGAEMLITPLELYRRVRAGVPGYTPTQFMMTVGNPFSSVDQAELAWFAQNDWTPTPKFTFSSGVRVEWQTNISGVRAAPRLGFAYQPAAALGIIRAGAGYFDDRFDPDLTLDTLRFDGQRQKQFVVDRPIFFPIIPPSTIDPPAILQTIRRIGDDIKAARLTIANIGWEREFGKRFMASVGYTVEKGERLTRFVDVNAPLSPGVRPDPTLGQVLAFQSVGRSRREEVQVGLRVSFNEGSRLLANYTYSETMSDVDNERSIPADSRNLGIEYGPTALQEPHRVFVSGTLMFPRFWLMVPSFTYASARPFNITSGLDINFDRHLTDRPAFATPGEPGAIATAFGLFDPTPEPGDTIIPRNYGRAAPSYKFDLSLSKVLVLDDPNNAKRTLTLSINGENLFNTATLRDYNGVVLSPLFATPNTAEPGRRLSAAIILNF